MKTLWITFRSFFKKGKNNLIKIISLGLGLALSLVLFAKVYFEQSYDDFFPDGERIYRLQTNISRQSGEIKEFSTVSGGIAPGMKTEIPEVEMATRYTPLKYEKVDFITPDKKKYSGLFIFGDTCLFDIFPLPILAGHVKESLGRPMYALVSKEIASQMGGMAQAMGQTFELDPFPGKTLTIGGVFDDIPENSHLNFDVVVSLPSISEFTWDGSNGWVGNDRYIGYVKLLPGVSPESLKKPIRQMQERHQPLDELTKSGVDFQYSLTPLHEIHSGTSEAKRMNLLLSLLAFALLFTAVMNYILVFISSLVKRAREVAVNKCYGASEKDIRTKMFAETLIHMFFSLVLAAFLIILFRSVIRDILGASLGALFTWQSSLLLLAICVMVYLVTSLIPGAVYARIPVASAFRGFNEGRRVWKLGLLFVQFTAAGFLFCLLAVITLQYHRMIHDDPGYSYDKLAYCDLSKVDSLTIQTAVDELSRLPEVAMVSTCTKLPFNPPSGNYVCLPGDERRLFHFTDLFEVGNGYLNMMEIPIIEGSSFQENKPTSREVMVSRRFVEKILPMVDWKDGVVGKEVWLSEHSEQSHHTYTICGVYEDIRIETIQNQDTRPTVMFYSSHPSRVVLVKFHKQTREALKRVSETLQTIAPTNKIVVKSYSAEMVNLYQSSRRFRDSVMISSIVTLIISLTGLIGYTNDEMNRRRKETAIRKVNGATISDILKLFLKNIIRIALPALTIGACIAAYIASKWQEGFSEKVPLTPLLFIASGFIVFIVILSVVSISCYRFASENPSISIKSE